MVMKDPLGHQKNRKVLSLLRAIFFNSSIKRKINKELRTMGLELRRAEFPKRNPCLEKPEYMLLNFFLK
jgi:hypothetical protein